MVHLRSKLHGVLKSLQSEATMSLYGTIQYKVPNSMDVFLYPLAVSCGRFTTGETELQRKLGKVDRKRLAFLLARYLDRMSISALLSER